MIEFDWRKFEEMLNENTIVQVIDPTAEITNQIINFVEGKGFRAYLVAKLFSRISVYACLRYYALRNGLNGLATYKSGLNTRKFAEKVGIGEKDVFIAEFPINCYCESQLDWSIEQKLIIITDTPMKAYPYLRVKHTDSNKYWQWKSKEFYFNNVKELQYAIEKGLLQFYRDKILALSNSSNMLFFFKAISNLCKKGVEPNTGNIHRECSELLRKHGKNGISLRRIRDYIVTSKNAKILATHHISRGRHGLTTYVVVRDPIILQAIDLAFAERVNARGELI